MQNKVMDKILEQINRNKLHNLSYAFLIAQLCVLNNKSFEEIQKIVDKLITKKLIRINTKDNTVVNSKKINSEYKVETESNIDIANKILKIDPKKVNKRGKKQRIQCKIDGTKKGYAFGVALNNEVEDVFIPARDLKGAVNNDIVIVEVLNPESKKPEGKVVQILERGNERIVGTIQLYKNNAFVLPDDVKFGKDIFVLAASTVNNSEPSGSLTFNPLIFTPASKIGVVYNSISLKSILRCACSKASFCTSFLYIFKSNFLGNTNRKAIYAKIITVNIKIPKIFKNVFIKYSFYGIALLLNNASIK